MSFKQNDSNDYTMIHLGNYEEFFILYLDNELTDEQNKMVEEFLVRHPDLQGELELLMGTRLPAEEFSIDKNELLSQRMKLNTIDEELLLFIDNELPVEQGKKVELELKSNRDYWMQHELMLKTRLDASEKIVYPNKKELYKQEEEKLVVLRPWMRVAAAAVVIAVAGLLYYNSSSISLPGTEVAASGQKNVDTGSGIKTIQPAAKDPKQETGTALRKETAPQNHGNQEKINAPKPERKPELPQAILDNLATLEHQNQDVIDVVENPAVLKNRTPLIDKSTFSDKVVAAAIIKTPSGIVNNNSVTSVASNRNTTVDAATSENKNEVAINKGSVKGFLRKATRVIEKRTGIDPTNDGELLIGAVAINLK